MENVPRESRSPHLPSAPPNYRSRTLQYRLLPLVFSLMLLLVIMGEARKPKNWQWLWQGQEGGGNVQAPAEGRSSDAPDDPVSNDNVDARLPDANEGAPVRSPDSFRAEVDKPQETPKHVTKLLTKADAEAMGVIRDDTVLRGAEFDVWYRILNRLDEASVAEIAEDQPQSVAVTQLFRQSKAYRGKLVRVEGTVHRAHYVTARPNDYGISGYWQCWLFQAGGTNNPIVIYSLEMPEGFPQGMSLREAVSFDGIYYKRWAYQAKMDLLSAPLVLAKRGTWKPEAPRRPIALPPTGTIIGLAVATALAAAFLAWWAHYRSIQRLVNLSASQLPEHLSVDAERRLADVAASNVGQRIEDAVAQSHSRLDADLPGGNGSD